MKKLENKIKKFMKDRDWDDSQPADLAKSISIEASELLEHFQWRNWSNKEIKDDVKKYLEIQSEIADVLIYYITLASTLGFDVQRAVTDKLKVASEKYPAYLFKNKKDARGQDVYEKIKKSYRGGVPVRSVAVKIKKNKI